MQIVITGLTEIEIIALLKVCNINKTDHLVILELTLKKKKKFTKTNNLQ